MTITDGKPINVIFVVVFETMFCLPEQNNETLDAFHRTENVQIVFDSRTHKTMASFN